MSTDLLEDIGDVNNSYAPIIVVCNSCGVLYDYVRANKSCPVCGSTDHRTLFISFGLGSPIMYVRGEHDEIHG